MRAVKMATRTGRLSTPDAQGQYARQLGWKIDPQGRRVQHKFRLGTDRKEAQRRDDRLRAVWEQVEAQFHGDQPVWDSRTLEIARQLAKGADIIRLAPDPADELPGDYARRLQETQNRFATLRFTPTDRQRYVQGIGDRAYDLREILVMDNPYDEFFGQKEARDLLLAPPLQPESLAMANNTGLSTVMFPTVQSHTPQVPNDGATLHQAIDAYIQWIKKNYFDPDLNDITEYAHTKIGQMETLKSRHKDVPLCEVDFDFIEEMYRFWRQRPYKKPRGEKAKKKKQERISRESVRHYIGELHRFFKWLHRTKAFAWRKPDDFDDIDRSVPQDADSIKKRIRGVDTFSLEELCLLNRYATPIQRLYLMLALNCGFGAKEIATLTIGEVYLHQALSQREQEVFNFPSTSADSFVTLVRNKTTIVGKWVLFRQTVQMLEWMLARRLKQPNPTPAERLVLNGTGHPLDRQSDNGNPSRQIPNSFAQLKTRIRNDEQEISELSFKYLRKTAADLVRRFSDGEVAGVFMLHGQPVKTDKLSDVYTNRPYGKVYDAIRQVEDHLQPMFQEAGDDPTLQQPQAYTTRRSIDRIADMKKEGATIRDIAEKTGKSRSTVHRHILKLKQRGVLEE